MLTKEKIIETIKSMPETFSVDDVLERIVFLNKIENGLQDSATGNTITHEELKLKYKIYGTNLD
jgi:predicted transcriptional regulator